MEWGGVDERERSAGGVFAAAAATAIAAAATGEGGTTSCLATFSPCRNGERGRRQWKGDLGGEEITRRFAC